MTLNNDLVPHDLVGRGRVALAPAQEAPGHPIHRLRGRLRQAL